MPSPLPYYALVYTILLGTPMGTPMPSLHIFNMYVDLLTSIQKT